MKFVMCLGNLEDGIMIFYYILRHIEIHKDPQVKISLNTFVLKAALFWS